jgi:putative transposase
LKIKIYPSRSQKKKISDIDHICRYVKNKAIESIKNKEFENVSWQNLRNKYVTMDTHCYYEEMKLINKLKKICPEEDKIVINEQLSCLEKTEENKKRIAFLKKSLNKCRPEEEEILNQRIKDFKSINPPLINDIRNFEKEAHKDIRTCCVKQVASNYKTCMTNLRNGNIKFFSLEHLKRDNQKTSIPIDKSLINFIQGKGFYVNFKHQKTCGKLDDNYIYKISNKCLKKYKNLKVSHDSVMIKQNGNYFICIPISIDKPQKRKTQRFCGVDPGLRDFMNVYNHQGDVTLYSHDRNYLKEKLELKRCLKSRIKFLKINRTRKVKKIVEIPKRNIRTGRIKKRLRKTSLLKIEKKLANKVDQLHWDVILDLLKNNDIIFIEDFKSHEVVKNNKNKSNNSETNLLKFYQFKQRLLYKAKTKNVKVHYVNARHTTQTCSSCGVLNKEIGSSKTFSCVSKSCDAVFDRDINSCKNIILKGSCSLL